MDDTRLMTMSLLLPVLFDLMMALQAIETHSITLENLTLFRPKLRNSSSTNQIAYIHTCTYIHTCFILNRLIYGSCAADVDLYSKI